MAGAPENVPVAPPAPTPAPAPPPIAGVLLRYTAAYDHDAIGNTLRRYQAAYRALDVNGLLQVYPTLARDQAEQLRRTFASVSQYEVEIRNPQIEVQGDTAIARAELARRMSPRVGNPVTNEVQTEFRLRREGGMWHYRRGHRAVNDETQKGRLKTQTMTAHAPLDATPMT